jgi:hypothetical protein
METDLNNSELFFTALHVTSGANNNTNILLVPANATWTIENIYLENGTAGTITDITCPTGELEVAHYHALGSSPFQHQFSNLNAVIGPGTQCVYGRMGAGATEHTYAQVQYYKFDATRGFNLDYQYKQALTSFLWALFVIIIATSFFAVVNYFIKKFKK